MIQRELTVEQTHELLNFVPSWHVCVLGPVPLGEAERVRVSISNIICETEEEALAKTWGHIAAVCERSGHEVDVEEWDLLHVQPVNQS